MSLKVKFNQKVIAKHTHPLYYNLQDKKCLEQGKKVHIVYALNKPLWGRKVPRMRHATTASQ